MELCKDALKVEALSHKWWAALMASVGNKECVEAVNCDFLLMIIEDSAVGTSAAAARRRNLPTGLKP